MVATIAPRIEQGRMRVYPPGRTTRDEKSARSAAGWSRILTRSESKTHTAPLRSIGTSIQLVFFLMRLRCTWFRINIKPDTFHKTCFKCHECNTQLRKASYERVDGKFFCRAHYDAFMDANPELAMAVRTGEKKKIQKKKRCKRCGDDIEADDKKYECAQVAWLYPT